MFNLILFGTLTWLSARWTSRPSCPARAESRRCWSTRCERLPPCYTERWGCDQPGSRAYVRGKDRSEMAHAVTSLTHHLDITLKYCFYRCFHICSSHLNWTLVCVFPLGVVRLRRSKSGDCCEVSALSTSVRTLACYDRSEKEIRLWVDRYTLFNSYRAFRFLGDITSCVLLSIYL